MNISAKVRKVVYNVIVLLEQLNEFLKEKTENIYEYEDLTPDDNVDEDGGYCKTLDWALKNEKIRNIALTGTYGSGKSSIIKTYQNKNYRYKFLNVSLANFSVEIEEKAEIEKNILLQMFYQVKNDKIPYSRFKKITNLGNLKVLLITFIAMTLFVSGLIILNPKVLFDIKDNISLLNIEKWILRVVVVTFFMSFWFCFLWLIKFFKRNYKINKVMVEKTGIEVSAQSTEEHSIFNKYIDEIMYFFEVTKYNIIVFEDLDRFDKNNAVKIFTKLREINTLINKSEQVNRKIVFVYAIMDDLFSDSTSRTKFFDFIIPVIPVINSSNSCDIWIEKFNKYDKITEKFINNITIYINDMRTLKNIYNEFIVYKDKLSKSNLILENLLGIVVYKNVYPEDFAKLQVRQGLVFEVFQNKQKVINNIIDEIDEKCAILENNIQLAEKESLISIDELQVVYFEALLRYFRPNGYFFLGNQQISISNSFKEQYQNRLESGENISNNYQYNNGPTYDYFTANNTKDNYLERKELILKGRDYKIEEFKKEIEKLKDEKSKVKFSSLNQIINEENLMEVFPEIFKDEKLLVFLIKRGYINELYDSYITYFYEGKITRNDMKFLTSVKNGEELSFDFKLEKCKEIIAKMYIDEFNQHQVLNHDLLDFILNNKEEYSSYLNVILSQLINETEKSINFIESYLQNRPHCFEFVSLLCNRWENMWNFIDTYFLEDKKEKYLLKIIEFANINDICRLNTKACLSRYISNKENFLELIEDKYVEKVERLLKEMNIKFILLQEPSNMKLFEYIYEQNMYRINEKMIQLIMKMNIKEQNEIERLDTANFTTIKNSNCNKLIKYIENNLEEYLNNVLLKLENNNAEDENIFIELLNNESISIETKVRLVDKENTIISNIQDVSNKELWNRLIESGKVSDNWSNILSYYQDVHKIDRAILTFLNKNCSELSKHKLNENKGVDDQTCVDLAADIARCEDIEFFEEFRKSIPYSFSKLNVNGLSEIRLDRILRLDLLSLTLDNFNSLKKQNKHILLIERNIEAYLENKSDFDIDSNDIEFLLGSKIIDNEQKRSIIQKMNMEFITNDNTLVEKIYEFILNQGFGEFSEELFITLLKSNALRNDDKLKLINKTVEYLSQDTIMNSFAELEEPYSDISINGKRPLVDRNSITQDLFRKLYTKGYISSVKDEGNKLRVNTKMA